MQPTTAAIARLGFNKLIYRLLLHKVGRKYAAGYRFEVYLDERLPEDEASARRTGGDAITSKWLTPSAHRLTW